MPALRPTLLAISLGVLACGGSPTDRTPTGAVRLFLQAMQRAERDPDARADAYRLLARDTRLALAERAHQTGALGGRTYEPWEMLVEGRFRLNFRPRSGRGAYREERDPADPERAVVVVRGEQGEEARVPLVAERGRWRLVLAVPHLRADPS